MASRTSVGAHRNVIRRFIPFAAVALFSVPLQAFAQVAPSQVTPQTLRPDVQIVQPELAPIRGGRNLRAPAGSEKLNFIVGRIAVEGSFAELADAPEALIRAIQGRRATVAEIYQFANALEQIYARAGYVLARVTVPPQKLGDNGTVRIVVIDGYVEKVQIDNVPERVRGLVYARMAWLVGRQHVKLDEIERQLLIAGDVPGLRLKSTLARGEGAAGALLVLDGTQHLVTATTTIDNRMPASLGAWSYGGNVALNSPLGFGEQFYVSAQSAGDPGQVFEPSSPLRVLGAGMVVPIGLDGWIVNPEYTNSRSVPLPSAGGAASIGHFERAALRTSYPLIRTRSGTVSVNGAFEYIKQSVTLPQFNVDLNRDSYGVARAGASFETGVPVWGAALRGSLTVSHGVGGRDASDVASSNVPLSRQGSSPDFNKVVADAQFTQPLPAGLRADVIGRFQTSFGQAMMASEQISLDGPQAISAYRSGTLSVDEGGVLRGELSRPFAVSNFAMPVVVSPYGFGAYGLGRLNDPTALEIGSIHAAAVGAGLRSNIDMPDGYQGVSIGLEVARQFTNMPRLTQAWRGNVNVSLRF